MSYEHPIYSTYTLPAFALDTTTAALSIRGPSGRKGVLIDLSCVVTVTTTTNPTVITLGDATDADAYGTLTVAAVTAASTAIYSAVITDTDDNMMPADTTIILVSDAGAAAGDGDIVMTIAWI